MQGLGDLPRAPPTCSVCTFRRRPALLPSARTHTDPHAPTRFSCMQRGAAVPTWALPASGRRGQGSLGTEQRRPPRPLSSLVCKMGFSKALPGQERLDCDCSLWAPWKDKASLMTLAGRWAGVTGLAAWNQGEGRRLMGLAQSLPGWGTSVCLTPVVRPQGWG